MMVDFKFDALLQLNLHKEPPEVVVKLSWPLPRGVKRGGEG